MRYLALLGISLLSMIFSSCVCSNFSVFGAHLDVLLAAMIAMVLLEKTMTPVFYCTGAALLMDAFFSRAMGFYALQYLLAGLVLWLVMAGRRVDLGAVLLCAAGAWVLREVMGTLLCFFVDDPINLGERMTGSILPGLVPQVLLGFLVYLLLRKVYTFRFIWPVQLYRQRD